MSDIIERLRTKGVTPAQALVDIERSPDYAQIIASDDGQALLEWLYRNAYAERLGEEVKEESE